MQNLSNEFDLHENEPADGTHFLKNAFKQRLILTQKAKGSSEMAYSHTAPIVTLSVQDPT